MAKQAGFTTIRVKRQTARALRQFAPNARTYADAMEVLIARQNAVKFNSEIAEAPLIERIGRHVLGLIFILLAGLGGVGLTNLVGVEIVVANVLLTAPLNGPLFLKYEFNAVLRGQL